MTTLSDDITNFLFNAPRNLTVNFPLASIIVKATLILLAALLIGATLRRASAAARHTAWTASIAGVLLLLVFSLCLPIRTVVLPAPVLPITTATPADAGPVDTSAKIPSALAGISDIATGDIAHANEPLHDTTTHEEIWVVRVLNLWLIGFLWVVLRTLSGIWTIHEAKIDSDAVEGDIQEIARKTAHSMGLRRRIDVRRARNLHKIVVPVTWGALRPVVLLPAQSVDWSEACLRAALLHEFAHIRRWDWLTQMTARVACAIYWFQPLVWLAAHQMRETSELACDDCVLNSGVAPADYAQRLVDVLRSIPEDAKARRTMAIAMALPHQTVGRIRAILAQGVNRQGVSVPLAIAAAALSLALILPAAALRVARPANREVVYSSGARFTLVGISRADIGYSPQQKKDIVDAFSAADGRPWWSVAGARIPDSRLPDFLKSTLRYHMFFSMKNGAPHYEYSERIFAFQAMDLPANSTFKVETDNSVGYGVNYGPKQGANRLINITLGITHDNDFGNIHLGVAEQPWKTIAIIPIPDGKTNAKTPWGDASIGVFRYFMGSSDNSPPQLGVRIVGPVANGETRILGVDRNGKTLTPTANGPGTQPRDVVGLSRLVPAFTLPVQEYHDIQFGKTPEKEIQQFVIQARSYEWREFHDVPLEPQSN